MSRPRPLACPDVESLDGRVLMATSTSTLLPPTHLIPHEFPSASTKGPFSPADLTAYAADYQSFVGASDFNPAFDFNGTGFIGQNDATPILRGLAGITPHIPLKLTLALAPGEQVAGHHPANSGGVTRLSTVTVVGKTTPNSIIFTDGPTLGRTGQTGSGSESTGNFKFQGVALTSNAQGIFNYTVDLAALSRGGSLTGTTFLVRTPFGQQTILAFPIRRLP